MDRRELLAAGAAALAASAASSRAFAQGAAPAAAAQKLKIDIYSRQLQWIRTADELAKAAVDMAYDGINLTVRTYPGHVDPTKVKADLPAWVKTIRGAGLNLTQITTNITDADSPNAEAILDAAAQQGITHYWWGTFRYDLSKPIQPQIDALKPRVAKLVRLNEKYKMKAVYHNYSGPGSIGNMIWDFLQVLKQFDPRYVGFHYDLGHATSAGSNGTWELGMRAAGPYIGALAFKDTAHRYALETPGGGEFTGTPEQLNARPPGQGGGGGGGAGGPPGAGAGGPPPAAPAGPPPAAVAQAGGPPGGGPGGGGGQRPPPGRGGGGATNPWRVDYKPLGTGMVDLPKVAQVMKDINFRGPIEIQAEYPLGGADGGQDKITIPRAIVLGSLKRDLLTLRAAFKTAGLI